MTRWSWFMTQHDARKNLLDIARASGLLTTFLSGKTFDDYVGDPLLRSAVERQFEIVGEALSQALRSDPSLASQVTDHSRIIAFRNRLIHGYASVSDAVVWGIIEANLPRFRAQVAALLEKLGE